MSSCLGKVSPPLFIDNHTGSAGRPFLRIRLSPWESESAYGQIPGQEIISSHHLSEGIMNMAFITGAIPKPHNNVSSFWQQAKWWISPWTVLDELTTTRGGRSQKWIIHTVTKWCTNYQAHLQRGGIPSRSQSSGRVMRGDGCEIKVGSRHRGFHLSHSKAMSSVFHRRREVCLLRMKLLVSHESETNETRGVQAHRDRVNTK